MFNQFKLLAKKIFFSNIKQKSISIQVTDYWQVERIFKCAHEDKILSNKNLRPTKKQFCNSEEIPQYL